MKSHKQKNYEKMYQRRFFRLFRPMIDFYPLKTQAQRSLITAGRSADGHDVVTLSIVQRFDLDPPIG